MSFDPNADSVEPLYTPEEMVADLDQDDQLAQENAEPLIPYPVFAQTDAAQDRWRECVTFAQNQLEGTDHEGDQPLLSFIARHVYVSDIPTG